MVFHALASDHKIINNIVYPIVHDGRRWSAQRPLPNDAAWQISAQQKNERHHRHDRPKMAKPGTTTVVATSAAVPMASESAGVSQLQPRHLQSDHSRQAGNWRSLVTRSFTADFPPGSGVGLTTGPLSGSGAGGCHYIKSNDFTNAAGVAFLQVNGSSFGPHTLLFLLISG